MGGLGVFAGFCFLFANGWINFQPKYYDPKLAHGQKERRELKTRIKGWSNSENSKVLEEAAVEIKKWRRRGSNPSVANKLEAVLSLVQIMQIGEYNRGKKVVDSDTTGKVQEAALNEILELLYSIPIKSGNITQYAEIATGLSNLLIDEARLPGDLAVREKVAQAYCIVVDLLVHLQKGIPPVELPTPMIDHLLYLKVRMWKKPSPTRFYINVAYERLCPYIDKVKQYDPTFGAIALGTLLWKKGNAMQTAGDVVKVGKLDKDEELTFYQMTHCVCISNYRKNEAFEKFWEAMTSYRHLPLDQDAAIAKQLATLKKCSPRSLYAKSFWEELANWNFRIPTRSYMMPDEDVCYAYVDLVGKILCSPLSSDANRAEAFECLKPLLLGQEPLPDNVVKRFKKICHDLHDYHYDWKIEIETALDKRGYPPAATVPMPSPVGKPLRVASPLEHWGCTVTDTSFKLGSFIPRARLTAQARRILRTHQKLGVVGISGAGKSGVIRLVVEQSLKDYDLVVSLDARDPGNHFGINAALEHLKSDKAAAQAPISGTISELATAIKNQVGKQILIVVENLDPDYWAGLSVEEAEALLELGKASNVHVLLSASNLGGLGLAGNQVIDAAPLQRNEAYDMFQAAHEQRTKAWLSAPEGRKAVDSDPCRALATQHLASWYVDSQQPDVAKYVQASEEQHAPGPLERAITRNLIALAMTDPTAYVIAIACASCYPHNFTEDSVEDTLKIFQQTSCEWERGQDGLYRYHFNGKTAGRTYTSFPPNNPNYFKNAIESLEKRHFIQKRSDGYSMHQSVQQVLRETQSTLMGALLHGPLKKEGKDLVRKDQALTKASPALNQQAIGWATRAIGAQDMMLSYFEAKGRKVKAGEIRQNLVVLTDILMNLRQGERPSNTKMVSLDL